MTHPRGNSIIWAVLSLTLRQCITSPPMPCAQQHDIWHGLDTPEIHAPWTSRKIHKAINIHHVYVAHIMWRHRIQPWASRRRMATSTELGSPLPLRLLWTSGGLVTSSCLLWWVPSLVSQDLCAIMTSAEYDHIENVSWKCCKCNTASCSSFLYQAFNLNVSNSFDALTGIPGDDSVFVKEVASPSLFRQFPHRPTAVQLKQPHHSPTITTPIKPHHRVHPSQWTTVLCYIAASQPTTCTSSLLIWTVSRTVKLSSHTFVPPQHQTSYQHAKPKKTRQLSKLTS